MWKKLSTAAVAALAASVKALELDVDDVQSINAAQALVATGLMDYYSGDDYGGTPGMFTNPYYWWEAGVAFGTMLDYTYYTGNTTWLETIKYAIQYQKGEYWNYMPQNQTTTEGNDDQGFWGVTVMAAAEKNFSAPASDEPSYAYLAQAVFNTMAARWDTQHCDGGLRWQIFTWNSGYDYKNTVSNGCLFHLAARLARYSGNTTFVDWGEKVWDWMFGTNFIYNATTEYRVYDGGYISDNCSDVRNLEWTYNYGLMMSGCTYLYNHTGESKWLDRAYMIWNRAQVFFNNTVMYEAACQPTGRCNTDQLCFKGIFSRFLGLCMLTAPEMQTDIWPYIIGSAEAAAGSCSGGSDGHTCGFNWFVNGWDGTWGLGQQIDALDLFNTLLINNMPGPYTMAQLNKNDTYGDAGLNTTETYVTTLDLGTKDKAGAGVITAVVLLSMLGSTWWLLK